MSKKPTVLLSTGLVVIVLAGVFGIQNFNKTDNGTGENLSNDYIVEITDIDTIDTINRPIAIDALYADFSDSLEEMKKSSDSIIIGKPTSHNQPKLGVVSTVSVLNTLKGKEFDEILIYQFGQVNEDGTVLHGDVLELNKEYVLFLGKQEDDKDNTFHVKAGLQGAFANENGNLINKDEIMKEEIKKVHKDKKDIKSEYESLIDYILE
ncbi:UNVERIFIED_CONTAM: hypothetical protein Cloal_0920 [Acetivibrio alkalicellulosi]